MFPMVMTAKHRVFFVGASMQKRDQIQDLLASQLAQQALGHDRLVDLARCSISLLAITTGSDLASGLVMTWTSVAVSDLTIPVTVLPESRIKVCC